MCADVLSSPNTPLTSPTDCRRGDDLMDVGGAGAGVASSCGSGTMLPSDVRMTPTMPHKMMSRQVRFDSTCWNYRLPLDSAASGMPVPTLFSSATTPVDGMFDAIADAGAALIISAITSPPEALQHQHQQQSNTAASDAAAVLPDGLETERARLTHTDSLRELNELRAKSSVTMMEIDERGQRERQRLTDEFAQHEEAQCRALETKYGADRASWPAEERAALTERIAQSRFELEQRLRSLQDSIMEERNTAMVQAQQRMRALESQLGEADRIIQRHLERERAQQGEWLQRRLGMLRERRRAH